MKKEDIIVGNTYLHSNGHLVKVLSIENNYIPITCEWVDSGGCFSCVPEYLSEIIPKKENNMRSEEKIPRRIRLDLYSPVELAIYNVMIMIEKMPADIKLTLAGQKLMEAKNLVADFIDNELNCLK